MFEHAADYLNQTRVGYVVKRYPRFSETFIVNEILAHEAIGVPIEIYSVRPPVDSHFQDLISQVRAPVHYLPTGVSKTTDFWGLLQDAASRHPIIAGRMERLLDHAPSDVVAAVSLASHSIDNGLTHLHAHFATSASQVAWLASQLTDIPFTMTAHAKDIFHRELDPEQLAAKLAAAKATVTVSDFNVAYLQEQFGNDARNVIRIYNGLNLQQFPFLTPCNRRPTILAVGRFVEKKGFDVLIDACAELVSRDVEFKCDLIGDGGLLETLRRQVDRLGLENYIHFLGPQPQEVVKAALREAAVFAAPCVEGSDGNRDGLPTVLLESMALGTPCVSTPVTGIPEAIVDGETGMLVPQRDAQALADALQCLLINDQLGVRLATRAREHVEQNFDVRRNTAVLRELFGPVTKAQPSAMSEVVETVPVS